MWILLTALISALLTRLQIRVNGHLKLTAAPREDRWHSVPTPSSGGLAIFLGCAAGYCLVCPARHPRIALAAAVLWVFGFLDDRLRLSPRLKMSAQIAAAGFVVAGGVVTPLTQWYLLDAALSMFWIVMITNALNLIDNMDGLCGGVVVIICLFRCGFLNAEGYRADAALYAVIAAALAGFLIFNYHPARIFMGDCGTMPMGFALGALTLAGPPAQAGTALAEFFCPALIFAYPIFDVALVSVLRTLAGRPITQGGRDHSSHRLASLGLGQRWVVWILWLVTGIGCSIGTMVRWVPGLLLLAVTTVACLLGIFALFLARLPGTPVPNTAAKAFRAAA